MNGGFVDNVNKSNNGRVWPVRSGQGGSFGNLVILTSITPDSVLPGNAVNVTLTGTNFISGMTVNVSGTGVTVSNVTVNSGASATAAFTIAANAATGVRTVSVTTTAGTSNTVNFTINALPPTPTPAPISTPTPAPTPTPTPIVESDIPPEADFKARPTLGVVPLNVQFTDTSKGGPTGWFWDFGDVRTSPEQNPSHVYNLAGLYTVRLDVSNSLGKDSEGKTEFIDVRASSDLKAEFTADPVIGFMPLEVKFRDLSIGDPTSWIWTFGDGGQSVEQNPLHKYLRAGIFTAELTVVRSGDSSTEKKTNFINVIENRPVADFKASATAGEAPITVTFTDLSQPVGNIASWLWGFGDGKTETRQNPSHTYNIEGFYAVELTVSNESGADTERKTNLVTVKGQNIPVAEFSTSATVGVAPFNVQFFDQSEPVDNIGSWIWQFGDGTISVEQNPSHSYTKEGIFTVSLTVSNSFGADTETKPNITSIVGTSDNVIAGFSANSNIGIAPASIVFNNNSAGDVLESLWDFGDEATSNEKSPNHTYRGPGEYAVSLSVTGKSSADTEKKDKFLKIISEDDVVAGFRATPLIGNAPVDIQFVDKSLGDVSGWLWDFGDGSTSTGETPKHTYFLPGKYSVTLGVSGQSGASNSIKKEDFIEVLEGVAATPTSEVTPMPTPTPNQTPEPPSCLASEILADGQSDLTDEMDDKTLKGEIQKGDAGIKASAFYSTLNTLRVFRDTVLSRDMAGIKLIRFYYQHSKEVTELLNSDPALKARAVDGLTELTDMLGRGTANKGDSIRDVIRDSVSLRLKTEINRLIDEIAARGSEGLRHDIEDARRLLDTGY